MSVDVFHDMQDDQSRIFSTTDNKIELPDGGSTLLADRSDVKGAANDHRVAA